VSFGPLTNLAWPDCFFILFIGYREKEKKSGLATYGAIFVQKIGLEIKIADRYIRVLDCFIGEF